MNISSESDSSIISKRGADLLCTEILDSPKLAGRHVWFPLGELAELLTGYPLHRVRGETGGHVPFVGVGDLTGSNDPDWQLETIPLPNSASLNRYRVQAGDIAVAAKGADLKLALLPGRWHGAFFGSNLIRIRLDGRFRPELLLIYLQSVAGHRALNQRRTGTRLLNLTVEHLSHVEVPVPPMAEQNRLSELVKVAREQAAEALRAARLRERIATGIVMKSFKAKGENP